MAGGFAARFVNDEDSNNYILMHAMGATTAGQRGRVAAGGILLSGENKIPGWERVIETAVPSCYNDFEERGVG